MQPEQAEQVVEQVEDNEWVDVEATAEADTEVHSEAGEEEEAEAEVVAEAEPVEEVDLYLGDDKLESPSSEEVKDTDLVKKLRKEIQERNKELAALRANNKPAQGEATQVETELVKPTLEDSLWDEEVYQQKMDEYYAKQQQLAASKQQQEAEQKRVAEIHTQKIAAYTEAAKKLGVPNFAEAEARVIEDVPENIQAMVLHYADRPEVVVLAAGLNAGLRKQLAEVTDPVALGKLIGSIESKAKLLPKSQKPTPNPTAKVKGSQGAGSQSVEDKAFSQAFPDAVIR